MLDHFYRYEVKEHLALLKKLWLAVVVKDLTYIVVKSNVRTFDDFSL